MNKTIDIKNSLQIRRFRPYPKYKDSGVEWLGDIPKHWNVRRLKHIASVKSSNVDKKIVEGEQFVRLCNYVDVYYNDYITPDLNFMEATASRAEISKFILREGDVLITKDSESWDDIAIPAYVSSGLDGVVCGYHLAQIQPNAQQVIGEYLFRSFHARGLNDQFRVAATGITRYGLGKYWIDNSLFLVPQMDEQRAIAKFLDRETAKIDALIAKKQRMIELLQEKRKAIISHVVTKGLNPDTPMKDSGVKWLGKVPKHWRIKKLKYASKLQTGLTLGKKYEDKDLVTRPYLRVANVQEGYLDLNEITEIDLPAKDVGRYELKPGDVLMTEGGDFDKLGRGYVWEGQIQRCLHQNHIFSVRAISGVLDPHYLASLMGSSYGKAYFTSTSNQTTNLASTNSTKLRNSPLPLPPFYEQREILGFLSSVTSHISNLTSSIETGIEKLHEYRTALISAAVTGKIDVRKQQSQEVVDIKARQKANPYFRRAVLAAEVVSQLHNQPTFGRVKLQKCLFLAEHHLKLDGLQSNYYRAAAGPFDNRMIRSIESQLAKQKWFKTESGKKGTRYRAMENKGRHRQYFNRYWGGIEKQLQRLLDSLKPMNTQQTEIVATLYGVWNDFLIKGKEFDDNNIVDEVLNNWDNSKKKIAKQRWFDALSWMREKGLVPHGFGAPTK